MSCHVICTNSRANCLFASYGYHFILV
jgi:hypothetical protein